MVPRFDWLTRRQRSESRLCLAECSCRQITPLQKTKANTQHMTADTHTHTHTVCVCACTLTCTHRSCCGLPLFGLMSSVSSWLDCPPTPPCNVQLCSTLMTWTLCNLIAARPDELSRSFISFQSTQDAQLPAHSDRRPCSRPLHLLPAAPAKPPQLCQVHLSASTTLKCAIRLGQRRASADVRNVRLSRSCSFTSRRVMCHGCTFLDLGFRQRRFLMSQT